MILTTIAILVFLYILYTVVPELLGKVLHIGIIHRGAPSHRAIALTFDDGPDPRYTPEVLRILKAYQAKATFFLVGESASRYPNLVQQILEDGHEIGAHNMRHQHAWLLHPVSAVRNVIASKRTLETLTGQRLRFYRPPWGAFSIANRWACAALGLKPVLWSLRAKDWYAGDYADKVIQRVVSGAHPGAIVLCHDAGGANGAPRNTIAALPVILERLGRLGYAFDTVGNLVDFAASHRNKVRSMFADYPFHRRLFIHLWGIVEWAFARYYHFRDVNDMFRISPARWRHGSRTDEMTGTVLVADGDEAIDLHFQNETIIMFSSAHDNRALVKGLRMTKEGFRDLARILRYDDRFRNTRVVMAVTLMNRGMEMLGFHVEDLPETRQKRRLRRYMQFLMGFYHPDGFSRLKQGRRSLELRLIWMTRDELIARYGTPEAQSTSV